MTNETIDGFELVSLLEEMGWEIAYETSKHTVMLRAGCTLTVPNSSPLAPGVLRRLIAYSGLRQTPRLLFEN